MEGAVLRVLDATNDLTFNVDLAAAWRAAGAQVHVGTAGLLLGHQPFDIVHCHWPEELVDWQVPPPRDKADRAIRALERAGEHAFLVCTMHNLLPHSAREGDAASRDYYLAFLRRMDAIGHFSQTSLELTRRAYPEIDPSRHFVHGMNLFPSLGALAGTRAQARAMLGLDEDRLAVAVFGQMRHAQEVALVHRGVDLAGLADVQWLLAARLPREYVARRFVRNRWCHARWLRRHGVHVQSGYLPDETVAAIFRGVDAVIIPRSGQHLNSGLLPLAMTFGTPLIAPDHGVYREFLAGTDNLLYRPADPASLADALRQLPALKSETVRGSNRDRATAWGCDVIVRAILDRAGKAVRSSSAEAVR